MKIVQIGPYPPPLGGWSFHIQKFQEYLTSRNIENQVLNVGVWRKKNIKGCISVHGFWDYCSKQISFLQKGYVLYNHVDGCSWKGFLLTITSQLLSLMFFCKAQLSFHAGLHQDCFAKGRQLYKFLGFCCFHLAGSIICNSDLVKDRIAAFGKGRAKIHSVPCFSEQYLDFTKDLSKEQCDFIETHEPLLFTYLFFRKGFAIHALWDAMAEVCQKYPKAGMVVVGIT